MAQHRRETPPSGELELQAIMHDYLSACFDDFIANPSIGGSIKNFKPDCGIRMIGAAIEFKFAATKEMAVSPFTGVVEDTRDIRAQRIGQDSMPFRCAQSRRADAGDQPHDCGTS